MSVSAHARGGDPVITLNRCLKMPSAHARGLIRPQTGVGTPDVSRPRCSRGPDAAVGM